MKPVSLSPNIQTTSLCLCYSEQDCWKAEQRSHC